MYFHLKVVADGCTSDAAREACAGILQQSSSLAARRIEFDDTAAGILRYSPVSGKQGAIVPTRSKLPVLLAAALIALLGRAAAPTSMQPVADPALAAAIADPARPAPEVARDPVRHPLEELRFFGLERGQTVVELWPGAGYWTDILGPYLASRGHFYVALPPAGSAEEDAAATR
jgi:hypothetical protein